MKKTAKDDEVILDVLYEVGGALDSALGMDWENTPDYRETASRYSDVLVFLERGERMGVMKHGGKSDNGDEIGQ